MRLWEFSAEVIQASVRTTQWGVGQANDAGRYL